MKRRLHAKLLLLFGLCGMGSPVFAEEPGGSLSIEYASIENGIARSIGVYGEGMGVAYLGASLNYIAASTPIQFAGRKEIAPIYIFAGLKAPWGIAPYIEGGVDLIDGIFDDLDSSEDHEDTGEDVDYYLAAGLKYAIDERFTVSVYAKKYVFKFREDETAPLIRKSHSGYGAGLSMRF